MCMCYTVPHLPVKLMFSYENSHSAKQLLILMLSHGIFLKFQLTFCVHVFVLFRMLW